MGNPKEPPDHWLVTIIDLDFLGRHGTMVLGGEADRISRLVGMGMVGAALMAVESAVEHGRARPAQGEATLTSAAARRAAALAAVTVRRDRAGGPSDG